MTLLLALLALPLAAQDLWLAPSEFLVSPGQAIAVSIRGAERPAEVRDASLITATAAYNITNLRMVDGTVLGTAVAKGKGIEILAVRSNRMYAKALVLSEEADQTWSKRVGHVMEIVPLENPYAVRPGSVLGVEVRLRGQHAPGVVVSATDGRGGMAEGQTDAFGRATIKLTVPGRWRLRAVAGGHADDGGSYSASLTFEIRDAER